VPEAFLSASDEEWREVDTSHEGWKKEAFL
jgi:hypothetical protein